MIPVSFLRMTPTRQTNIRQTVETRTGVHHSRGQPVGEAGPSRVLKASSVSDIRPRGVYALPFCSAYRLYSCHTVGWAFYNSIRYFLSFRLYDKSAPQAYAFSLGACTGTSAALAICRFAIGFITFKPQRTRVDLVGPVLAYLSSFLLLIPAVVNLVLVTTTKRSNDLQFNVLHRCRLDVDVVWSVTRRICEPPESRWTAWAVVAAVRFVVTLFLLVSVSPSLPLTC